MGNFNSTKVERDILNRMIKAVREATDDQDVTGEVEAMIENAAGDGVAVGEGATYAEELAWWVDAIAYDVAHEVRAMAFDRANESAQWSSVVVYTAEAREYHERNFGEVEAKICEMEHAGLEFESHEDAVRAAVCECLTVEFQVEWLNAADAVEDFGLDFQVEPSVMQLGEGAM